MTRPHVVHIIDRLPPDGAERLLVDVLKNRSHEFKFTVVCLVAGGELVAELENMDVPVIIFKRKHKLDIGLIFRLRKWLRRNNADVVHTHLFTADSWGRLAAFLARVPCIVNTVHSTNTWKTKIHRLIDRVLAKISTNIIACSDEVAKVLIQDDGISAKHIKVVANGIDLRRFEDVSPINLATEPDTVNLVVIGRLHPAKGHQDLIPVIKAIKDKCSDFHFYFVGEGELRADIEKNIKKQGLLDAITLMGQRQDIPAILAAIDIFVMPSKWEGLPMALLEAMAMGKTVIATRVGGIPDVITHNENGLLVDVGDGSALAENLVNAITDNSLRQRLGAAAKEMVRQHYSAETVSRKYEQIYKQTLMSKGALID